MVVAVDIKSIWTGRIKKRYLCHNNSAVERLKRKYRHKLVKVEVSRY